MQALTNRKLASPIASAERWTGGYRFGGTSAVLDAPGWARDQLQYLVHSVREFDRRPLQGLTATNKRLLSRAPIGARVSMNTRGMGYASWCEGSKVGPCRWEETGFEEEDMDD